MEIWLLEIAETELDEAVIFYNSEQPGLGADFIVEFIHSLERIKAYPKPGTRSLKILAAANYDDSPMELSTKHLIPKFWLSPFPTCTGNLNIGKKG